jgi:hypothetical protein
LLVPLNFIIKGWRRFPWFVQEYFMEYFQVRNTDYLWLWFLVFCKSSNQSRRIIARHGRKLSSVRVQTRLRAAVHLSGRVLARSWKILFVMNCQQSEVRNGVVCEHWEISRAWKSRLFVTVYSKLLLSWLNKVPNQFRSEKLLKNLNLDC